MIRIFGTLHRIWIPVVQLAAVALSRFTMYRTHGISGSRKAFGSGAGRGADQIMPFNPKRVLYETYGPSGAVGSVSYLDENVRPRRADFTTLPWSYQVTTTP